MRWHHVLQVCVRGLPTPSVRELHCWEARLLRQEQGGTLGGTGPGSGFAGQRAGGCDGW